MSRIMSTVFGQLCSWILVTLTTWVACWWLVSPVSCHQDVLCHKQMQIFPGVGVVDDFGNPDPMSEDIVWGRFCRVYPGICFWRCSCTSRTLSRGFNGSPSSHGRAWSGGFGGRLCRSSKSPRTDPAHQEQATRFVLRCDGWKLTDLVMQHLFVPMLEKLVQGWWVMRD